MRAGAAARLGAKQALLATLLERARDTNAYTRARVLQTWAHLAGAAALPLGHWVAVTELAIGEAVFPTAWRTACWICLGSENLRGWCWQPTATHQPLAQLNTAPSPAHLC